MLTSTLVLLPVFAATTGQLPDELDLLRSLSRTPQVVLLLDRSGSMGNGADTTNCVAFAKQYKAVSPGFGLPPIVQPSDLVLDKNEVMRASLTGCVLPDDGILDKWADQVNFSVLQFPEGGLSNGVRASFGSNLSQLQDAVHAVGVGGGDTPMTRGLRNAGRYFGEYFNDGNTLSCRPNFIVFLSDGNPNGGAATFSSACDATVLDVGAGSPWLGSQYLYNNDDQLCSLSEVQNVTTYSIGFGADGSFDPGNLSNVATFGGGEYFFAKDAAGLDLAFESIISSIVDRSAVFYSSPAVQRSGLFSGNYVYLSGYKPVVRGRWRGNVKKLCLFPSLGDTGTYDPDDTSCMFRWNADEAKLYTNPFAVDQWNSTLTPTTTADIGGAGHRLLCGTSAPGTCTNGIGPAGGTPTGAIRPRNIVTWRPGTTAYVPVQPDSWAAADAWVSEGDRISYINQLHGYTFDADAAGNPVKVDEWPIGDAIHAPTVLLPYGDCETAGNCYVVIATNGGTLNIIDAATGSETTALIPGEAWTPNNVSDHRLADIADQPASEVSHRYYIDGGIRLYHNDTDADGVIDVTETAALIFGLGRGGRAYYMLDVRLLGADDGVLSADRTPIRPLQFTAGTEYAEMRHTWAAPWIGRALVGDDAMNVAVFPSGHVPQFDAPTTGVPAAAQLPASIPDAPVGVTCAAAAVASGFDATSCAWLFPGGYPDPAPLSIPVGPFKYDNATAYRLRFDTFDIDPNDTLYVQDGQGRLAAAITGNGEAAETWSQGLDLNGWTPWVYGGEIMLTAKTSGPPATTDVGFNVAEIQYRQKVPAGTAAHNPTVYVVDLDWWNSAPRNFAAGASAGGLVVRFARDCDGANCVDAATEGASDLRYMTCPVSAEPSVYTEGEKLSAIYWADECGQIFKGWLVNGPGGDTWKAKRLLFLNNPAIAPTMNVQTSKGQSRNWRKLFRRLDLVASTCPGQKVVGVYFGTGNVQRPAADDELNGAPANFGTVGDRDVVGVVWDDDSIANIDLTDLADVSGVGKVEARLLFNPPDDDTEKKYGWYWRLEENERMLRDPLVFKGTAYFKTFVSTSTASECVNAAGTDRVYAVDNCSARAEVAAAATATPEDRVAWEDSVDVGGDLIILTPKNAAPIVTHGNIAKSQQASVTPQDETRRIPFIYHWRIPRGY